MAVIECDRCGTENPEEFRFCPACGAPRAGLVPRQARKVVTALFCDVVGSTPLGEELDPEVLRNVITRYLAEIRAVIERHGGTVERFAGDAVSAVFGIPRVREDDALRAVRAAVEIRDRLPDLAREVGVALRFRTGVNTGLVLMGEGQNLAVGDAMNVAARLEQAAAPGEILLGPDTLRLVRAAVQVEAVGERLLKGKSEPMPVFRLTSVDPVAPGVARHMDAPLVGRERELHLLRDALQRAEQEQGCHLFTLLGPAGVGKSRLVAELLVRTEAEATVLQGRCLHYGEAITFWPLIEALAGAGEPAQVVLERLRGEGGTAVPQELFWEVRRLLESLAAERPVILHIDDLQWAQPMLLDLLDHVVDLSRGYPILVLCVARPELLDERQSWGGGKLNATTMLLEPLDAAGSERLLAQLDDGLDPAARARVIAASDGNPLFLEEMATLARERGVVTVPATIQALLAARIEHLALDERALLERGAIEGEVFHRLAIRALADGRLTSEIGPGLAGLVRKELIRPHPAKFDGDEAFRFRHLLIRDAAYEGLPMAERAELHARFARWLERAGVELPELDEIAGWHLEQALRYQRELGREGDVEAIRAAIDHLAAAGERARQRSDVAAACNLLERALALTPADTAEHARIAVDLAEQLISAGQLERAEALLASARDRPEIAALAALTRLEWLCTARPQEAVRAIESTLPTLLEQLGEVGDVRALARAHSAARWSHWLAGRMTESGTAARLAAEYAGVAGDEGLRSVAIGQYVSTLSFGPAHREEIAREVEKLESARGELLHAVWIKRARAMVRRLEGRFDEARRLHEQMVDDLESLGMRTQAAASSEIRAQIELSAGNPSAALAALLHADRILEECGEQSFRSTIQAVLADVHERLGDRAAARAAVAFSDELTAADDVVNFAITHAVRARLALSEGDGTAAEQWARSAVRQVAETDFLLDQGDAELNLAHVLAALGRTAEATTEAQIALKFYERKGDRPAAERAEEFLGHVRG